MAHYRIWHYALAGALLSGTFFSAPIAQAQTVPDTQLGTAGAGRVEEQFVAPDILRQPQPKIEVKELKVQSAPDGSDNVTFVLQELQLEGVSAYTENDVRPVYEGKLGQTITLTDLYAIAADLTRKYRADGYILTQVVVPPQTIEDGIARLMVVEGYIDGIQIQPGEGNTNDDSSLKLMRDYLAHLQKGGALNVAALERALLLIDDLPGMSSRAVLSPSATQTGAADLLVIVSRKKYDATISIDNFGSRYLGPINLSTAGSLNSVLGMNERITGQMVIAPDPDIGDELAYFALSYEQPLSSEYGTTIAFTGSYTHTEPGYDLDVFNVYGKSQYLAVTLDHPFIRSRAINLHGYATLDYRNVDTRNDFELTRRDRIRAVRLGSNLDFLDTLLGNTMPGYNMMNVEVANGIDLFGGSDAGTPTLSRPNANPDFKKVTAELQRLQRLTPEVNLLLAGKGQLSSGALLSSEEFGIGGLNYGRAYDPSELIGDDGVAGKIEVQWNEPRELPHLETYQLFGFYDIGKIWNDDATTADFEEESLASTGFGIRASFLGDADASFAVAFPLTRDIQTQQDRDPRVYFSLSKKF